MKKVAVVGGAGHVGLPLSLVIAESGFETIVVDIDEEKINSDLIISSLSKNTTYRTSKVKEKDTNKESFWSKIKGMFNKKS